MSADPPEAEVPPASSAGTAVRGLTRAPDPLRANSDLTRFWLGEGISLFGTQVTALAIPLTAVLVFGAGSGQLGLLRMLQLGPFLLFGLLFGVWVDRVRRRPVLVGANLSRAVLIGLVPLFAALGMLGPALLYGVAFAVGVATVLFDVCWLAYLPTLVPDRRQLVAANTRLGATSAAAEVAGPGLAGALIQVLGAPVALLVDAASYLVSVVSLLSIRQTEPRPPRSVDRRLVPELRDGLRWVIGNRYLRVVGLLGGTYNFFSTFLESVFLVYAIRGLGLNPGALGLVLSAGAVGGLLGASLTARCIRRWPIGRVYAVGTGTAFVTPLLLPAAGGPPAVVAGMLVAAFFLGYVGLGMANVIVISLRQAVTPPSLMGRMNAALRTLLFGLAALGAPAGGLLGIVLGLRPTLWLGAAGLAVAVVPLLLSPIPRLRELPPCDPTEDPDAHSGTGIRSSGRRPRSGTHRPSEWPDGPGPDAPLPDGP
jgi:MFS family permease